MAAKHITGNPEYINFHYQFDFRTPVVIISALYSIPATVILILMVRFSIFKYQKSKQNALMPEILASFVTMQVVGNLQLFFEFLVSRIPQTTIFTSYCASQNYERFEKVLRFCYLSFFFTVHLKNLLTVHFCLLRVVVLYCDANSKWVKRIFRSTPLVVLIAVLISSTYFWTPAGCKQLDAPFPFGSIIITALPLIDNVLRHGLVDQMIVVANGISVAVLTAMMFWKLKGRKKLQSTLNQKSDYKAEKSLTITMLLILAPIVLTECTLIAGLFGVHIFFFTLIRPFFLDARQHLATCYLFFSHPVFQKSQVLVGVGNKDSYVI